MTSQYYIGCIQSKSEKHFSIWFNDKSKARRCNECHDKEVIKKRLLNAKAESKENLARATPILKNLSKELVARNKAKTRQAISDIKDKLEFDKEFE